MRVRYVGEYYKVYLEKGKTYEAEVVDGMYSIYDVDDEDSYLYRPQFLEIVEE